MPAEVLARFLVALGIGANKADMALDVLAAAYRSWLTDRRILVVLDNAGTEEQVRPLLPGTATSAAIVTSRRRLVGLEVREAVRVLEVEPLPRSWAVRVLSGQRREPSSVSSLVAVAELCGGLPLALRLVGQRLASYLLWL